MTQVSDPTDEIEFGAEVNSSASIFRNFRKQLFRISIAVGGLGIIVCVGQAPDVLGGSMPVPLRQSAPMTSDPGRPAGAQAPVVTGSEEHLNA